ncbi:MAG: NAD-dependent epimerase/dehydratase family protein [Pseudomonadales bacterium]
MSAHSGDSGGRLDPGTSGAVPQTRKSSLFLTGATGFIGARLLSRLLDDGWSVRVLVREGSPRNRDIDPRASQISGDLADPAALGRGLAGTCAVINCAGTVRGMSRQQFETANVAGVRALCTAVARLSARPALLHLSSLAATEPTLSFYAQSKADGESVLGGFTALNWCVFRPSAVYGPGDVELKSTLAWARRGLLPVPGGNRSQRLSFLHVDDLVNAICHWLEEPDRHRHRTYGLHDGSAEGYDWPAIAACVSERRPVYLTLPTPLLKTFAGLNESLARISGRAVMLSRGKVNELVHPAWLCDNTAFTEASGWIPQIQLAHGVKALFES